MCGILGWQLKQGVKLTQYQKTVLSLTLAEEMEQRGKDSFGGLLWLPNRENITTIKNLGRITEKGQDLLCASSEAMTALMHTRAATTGAVTIPNSHPFAFGDTVGVHNGVVYNHKELLHKYNRDHEVDSMHIFSHLDAGLPIDEIDAYGAFIYTKVSDDYKSLWVVRSSSGQMSIANLYEAGVPTNDSTRSLGLIFASTASAIWKAAARANLQSAMLTIDSERLFEMREGICYDTKQSVAFRSQPRIYQTPVKRTDSSPSSVYGLGYSGSIQTESERIARYAAKLEIATLEEISALVYAEPTEANLRDIAGYARAHMRGATMALCPCCKCGMNMHLWGICVDRTCKTPGTCQTDSPICKSCGCFLVESVHRKSYVVNSSALHCSGCHSDCSLEDTSKGPNTVTLTKRQRKLAKKFHKQLRGETLESSSNLVKFPGVVTDISKDQSGAQTLKSTNRTMGPGNDEDLDWVICPACGKFPLASPASIEAQRCGTCRYNLETAGSVHLTAPEMDDLMLDLTEQHWFTSRQKN